MKKQNYFMLLLLFCFTGALAQDKYELGNNSKAYKGIPKGTVTKHVWKSSSVYPNTIRDYYVYVPKQYTASTPAALMVFQDGHAYVDSVGYFNVPIVFDNLISQGKMPVTIGLFVNPGHDMNAEEAENPWRATNRRKEYDELSPSYGRFLLDELIPELKKTYAISDNPKMRAISGLSSGGICAFTTAWNHTDKFQKVLSHIGSFTNINGGHNYPSVIRTNEPKNIKVFLQDGSNDLDNHFGNWWLANLQMESALAFKNYDYKFVGGTGEHNGAHGGAILPESLVWLWSDVVPSIIPSGVIPFSKDSIMVAGETSHFSDFKVETIRLTNKEIVTIRNKNKEQMFIVKEGKVKVKVGKKLKDISENSVFVLFPDDKGTIESKASEVIIYQISYDSKKAPNRKRGKENGGSFIVDFNDLTYKEHDKGGIRNYFRKATTMCPYYEMHVTNLNPGVKSHDPHTHNASEIILMIKGNTEMEIGGEKYTAKPGDMYFTSANVPHAIKNLGTEQAMYFAYQWE